MTRPDTPVPEFPHDMLRALALSQRVSEAVGDVAGELVVGGALVLDKAKGDVVGLRVGPTEYPFRSPMQKSMRRVGDTWQFKLTGLAVEILGRGATQDDAIRSWVGQFHTAYQRQMSGHYAGGNTQEALVQGFEQVVDHARLECLLVASVRQAGVIIGSEPTRRQVKWVGFEEPEWIPLDIARHEFAALDGDEVFEAIVHRDPQSWQPIELVHVELVPEDKRLTTEKLRAILDRAPGTSSVGESRKQPRS